MKKKLFSFLMVGLLSTTLMTPKKSEAGIALIATGAASGVGAGLVVLSGLNFYINKNISPTRYGVADFFSNVPSVLILVLDHDENSIAISNEIQNKYDLDSYIADEIGACIADRARNVDIASSGMIDISFEKSEIESLVSDFRTEENTSSLDKLIEDLSSPIKQM